MASRLPMAVAGLTAAIVIAACGSSSASSSSSSSTSSAHPTQTQTQQDVISFADCMRSHGVPGFPDPTTSPREFKNAFNTQAPAFLSAEMACRHLLPGGGPRNQGPARSRAQAAALLAFARCLRNHGFPGFPDPNSGGEITHEMLAGAGIDLHQPAVIQAADTCVSVTHGIITRAIVAKFIAGQ